MISHTDQQNLFRIVASNLRRDITCYAFGGNAMMYYGYKEGTKDIDLLFEDEESRAEFSKALELLGFSQTSPMKVYIPEKLREKSAPRMFTRGDVRFDVFVSKIFQTLLSDRMKQDVYAIHDYKSKQKFTIMVLRREILVILKAVTERGKDFEDILTIIKKTADFDWQYLVDEVIWQYRHGDGWVIIDMLKTMGELKKYIFFEDGYMKQLLSAADKRGRRT